MLKDSRYLIAGMAGSFSGALADSLLVVDQPQRSVAAGSVCMIVMLLVLLTFRRFKLTPKFKSLGDFHSAQFHLLVLPNLISPWPRFTLAPYFRLVVFLDANRAGSVNDRRTFIDHALSSGARSVICGGSYCSEIHDEFDTVIVEREADGTPYYDEENGQFIPTTWHDGEPVDEILWQAATSVGHGHDDFEADNPHIVVAILSDDDILPELRRIGSSLPDSLDCVVERE